MKTMALNVEKIDKVIPTLFLPEKE